MAKEIISVIVDLLTVVLFCTSVLVVALCAITAN